jgi:hypothetical protein
VRYGATFPFYVEVDEIYNLACPTSPVQEDSVRAVVGRNMVERYESPECRSNSNPRAVPSPGLERAAKYHLSSVRAKQE